VWRCREIATTAGPQALGQSVACDKVDTAETIVDYNALSVARGSLEATLAPTLHATMLLPQESARCQNRLKKASEPSSHKHGPVAAVFIVAFPPWRPHLASSLSS
jgi:hypothetical protein